MPRTTKPLTNTQITQAKSKGREYSLADGNGLYLRVKTNGSKLWVFNYSRPYTKKRANIGFGSFPALPLQKAREKQRECLELLAQDIDPKYHKLEVAQQKKEALENTLKKVATDWFEKKKKTVSPGYADDIWASLENNIFPTLGNTPIHMVRAKMVIDCLKPMEAKGALETLKRVCQRLNEAMVYAVNTGLIESNSLTDIRDAFDKPQHESFPTLEIERLPELMRTIATASIKLTTRCLIEWQLHNMSRPGEAARLEWSEIDFEKKLWVIPSSKMKRKREHIIPLSRQSMNILNIMKPISGNRQYVFPGDRNPRVHANPQTANMALKRMGFQRELVAHGLRSLASTTLNEQKFDPELIEICLSHIDKDRVRAAYNNADYIELRREILQWWSDHIEKAAEGNLSLTSLVPKEGAPTYPA